MPVSCEPHGCSFWKRDSLRKPSESQKTCFCLAAFLETSSVSFKLVTQSFKNSNRKTSKDFRVGAENSELIVWLHMSGFARRFPIPLQWPSVRSVGAACLPLASQGGGRINAAPPGGDTVWGPEEVL